MMVTFRIQGYSDLLWGLMGPCFASGWIASVIFRYILLGKMAWDIYVLVGIWLLLNMAILISVWTKGTRLSVLEVES